MEGLIFTQAELEEIRVQAKAEAAAYFKARLVDQLKAEIETSVIGVTATSEVPTEPKPESEDWVVAPTPSDSETFGETTIYGYKFRVNKTGTIVKMLVNGEWQEKKITIDHTNDRRAPFIYMPNRQCPDSKGTDGKVSVVVARIVLSAFNDVPDYIAQVAANPMGPRILFGLKLYKFKDRNAHNVHLSNLEWIDRDSFVRAVRMKTEKFS